MKSKRPFLGSFAASVAALVLSTPAISAVYPDQVVNPTRLSTEILIQPGDLLSDTLILQRADDDGVQTTQHRSHMSHQSHASHQSHGSHQSHSSHYSSW